MQKQLLACRNDHRLAQKSRIRWKDLHGEVILLLAGNQQFGAQLKQHCRMRGIHPVFQHRGSDINSLFWMVAAGEGLCPLVETGVRLPERLHFVGLPADGPAFPLDLLWRIEPVNPLVKKFVRELADGMSESRI